VRHLQPLTTVTTLPKLTKTTVTWNDRSHYLLHKAFTVILSVKKNYPDTHPHSCCWIISHHSTIFINLKITATDLSATMQLDGWQEGHPVCKKKLQQSLKLWPWRPGLTRSNFRNQTTYVKSYYQHWIFTKGIVVSCQCVWGTHSTEECRCRLHRDIAFDDVHLVLLHQCWYWINPPGCTPDSCNRNANSLPTDAAIV